MSEIEVLGLGQAVSQRLRVAGVTSLSTLEGWNRRELRSIPGIGPKTVARIEEAANEANIQLAEDLLAPYPCVREGRNAWDVRLSSFFLCGGCVTEWTDVAFRHQGPEYAEVLLSGTCQNCNQMFEEIYLAQWFLCGNCDRVARSIGRSVAAEQYVANQFEELCRGTSLRIVQLDRPVLRAHNSRMLETKVATIDFAVHDGQEKIAGIELKTGRNHLGGWAPVGSKMATFQLDHGDCDDITAVARDEGIFVYLFHAQVIDRATPPTTRYEATGLWWVDLYSFSESYQTSRTRPRETKTAAYYAIDRFRAFEEFRGHWESGDMATLRKRFVLEGPPSLYGHGPS